MTITPEAAIKDPRFQVLQGDEGENLRIFLRNGGARSNTPFLPTGWRWTADEPPKLEIPRRWRVGSSGTHAYHDDKPSAADLWDWVTPGDETVRYHCTVLDTWTGEKSTEEHTENPTPPECLDGADSHEWTSPIEIVGGIKENPGVQGKGGGVVIHEVCRRCGCHRHTDTWATDPETGEQGLEAVSYANPDETSAAYATATRLVEAASLEDKRAIKKTVADIDLTRCTSLKEAVGTGLCRKGVERWIGRHGTVTVEQLGGILHRLKRDDRIELAQGMAACS